MKVVSQKAAATAGKYFHFDPSFGPYAAMLRQKMEEASDTSAKFYRYLLKKFQQHPWLLQPFKNVEDLEKHQDLIELLQMSLMPLSASSKSYCMALAFLQPTCLFFYTQSFKETFIERRVVFNSKEDEISNLRHFVKLVLERCYHQNFVHTEKMIKPVWNSNTKTNKYYHLQIESRYIQVHCTEALPLFDNNWLQLLNADDEHFFERFKSFPSHKFRLEGFGMVTVHDVSNEVAFNKIRNVILKMHLTDLSKTTDAIEVAMAEFLNRPDIKIGITPFFKINGKVVYDRSFVDKCVGISSVEKRLEKGITVQDIYDKFAASPKPYIFSTIAPDFLIERPYLSGLVENNIKSFMVYPIHTRDGLMGVFELGAGEEGFIKPELVDVLQPIVPLITDLIYYMIELFDNRINGLVKQKFTPLQPAVEWKFNEAAWEYLQHQGDVKEDASIGNVVFKQVTPLYGSVDIRNSSIIRNAALQRDFTVQLQATIPLLQKLASQITLPIIENLTLKCNHFAEVLTDVLTSEEEMKITEFFGSEVTDFLKDVHNNYPAYANEIDHYFAHNDKTKGSFHRQHNAYEQSFEKINKSIVAYYDKEVERLQSVYPFYFEKYRTDGVEYNIYIGQSITPEKEYDPVYLKNLRYWQLTSMAHLAQVNKRLLSTMPVPMQTTQLILVHSYPIDIYFRKDERRFDVEGAYNIRYEMLKKRIDKVRIKTTLERLTQPGKIAIVYAIPEDVEDFLQHIYVLQGKNILQDDLETLELENLQGITGLKALRVGVNYGEDQQPDNFKHLSV